MTLRGAGLWAAAVFAFFVLPMSDADAACSDKKILSMANDGRSIKSIAKSCNMPQAKVRGVVDETRDELPKPQAEALPAPPQPLAQSRAKPKPGPAQEPEAPKGLPSGAGLASCDCKGSVPYGDKEPELRCQSGVSIATPCPGYCSPHGIAPWRRICS